MGESVEKPLEYYRNNLFASLVLLQVFLKRRDILEVCFFFEAKAKFDSQLEWFDS